MLALFGGEALSVTVMVVGPAAVPLGTTNERATMPCGLVVDCVTITPPKETVTLEFAANPPPWSPTEFIGLAYVGVRDISAALTVTWLPVAETDPSLAAPGKVPGLNHEITLRAAVRATAASLTTVACG